MKIEIDVSRMTWRRWLAIGVWWIIVSGVGSWLAKVIEAVAARAVGAT